MPIEIWDKMDSAANGLIEARDSEFQALFPIRGKMLNSMKTTIEKILANQEIVNIIKALDLELDVKTCKLKYDPKKLRYGYILIASDADEDGSSIQNLILTNLWTLCPELIINGHVRIAIPPLFRITTKKNEYIYLRDADALEQYKKEHESEKYIVSRNKGLGESDAEELSVYLLDKKTRNVVDVTVADVKAAQNLFDIFMGPSIPPRREYILKHSEEVSI